METAILIVWWIGLIGALLATLLILQEVFLVLGTLRHILRLARRTRAAAGGVLRHMEDVERLGKVAPPAHQLHEASSRLAAAATAVAQNLDALDETGGTR